MCWISTYIVTKLRLNTLLDCTKATNQHVHLEQGRRRADFHQGRKVRYKYPDRIQNIATTHYSQLR